MGNSMRGADQTESPEQIAAKREREIFLNKGTLNNIKAINEDQLRQQIDEQNAMTQQRKDFGQQLAQAATGQGPSVADLQLRAATDRTLAQQLAAARSSRNVNPALAFRQNQNAAMQANANLAGQAAQAKLQEQQQARAQFGNYLAQQEQAKQGLLGLGFQGAGANETAAAAKRAQESKDQLAADKQSGDMFNNAGKSIGGIMSIFSDERMKKDAKSAEKSSKSFLDALSAKEYKYKDEKHGKGKQVGVMAQDLEKAGPVGKQMVVDTKQGKQVDYGKGFGAILAAQVELNERLKELEKRYGKKG